MLDALFKPKAIAIVGASTKRHGIRVFGPNCQGIINSDPDLKAYCAYAVDGRIRI